MSIEVAGVTRFFGSTRAVWNMSMTVPAGSVTGLVGPNGAGKTTLLLMLAALLAPDDGTIRIAGLDPLTQPRQVHQAVGWMPDAFGTWDSLTCTEILMTFATAQGLDEDTGLRNAAEMLATVHLGEMARLRGQPEHGGAPHCRQRIPAGRRNPLRAAGAGSGRLRGAVQPDHHRAARRRQGLLPAHARGLHPPRAGSFRAALPVAAFAASG